MRRKGHRGHQPGKSIPIKSHPTRKFQDEEIQSGVARGPVDVDQVMADNFKPELYVEKFPHGFDPFEGDVTALQKKVVFRPSSALIRLGSTKKKTQYVNISSGVSGRGTVQHEKPFAPKNARYVEQKTQPLGEARVEHETPVLDKNSDPIEVQSRAVYDVYEDTNNQFQKTTRAYRQTQAQPDITTGARPDMAPEFDYRYGQAPEQSRKHRHNPDYGYEAAISGIQSPVDDHIPVRTAKASRGQVEAEIWTGDRYEYVAVNEYDREQTTDSRRQLTEDDYNQTSVPNYEEQWLEPIDETTVRLKDRRQKGDFERDQYADYDYNDVDQPVKDEIAPVLKNRRQKADSQRDQVSGIGDHREIGTEDPRDRWDAAEYRRGRRVQFASQQEPVYPEYDGEVPVDRYGSEEVVNQTRRHQARSQHNDAAYEIDHRSTRLPEEVEVHAQRRRAHGRKGEYVEQEQIAEGEAGYDIPDYDERVVPAELHTEQRRMKQSRGETVSKTDPGDISEGNQRAAAQPVKEKKTTKSHQVRTGLETDLAPSSRVRAIKSEKIRHQEGSTYAEKMETGPKIYEYEARTDQQPPSTRRQYSAKQASENAIPETDVEVKAVPESSRRNRRQISAKPDKEEASPQFDDPEGTRLVEKQQKGRGVDEFDITIHAGIDNPNETNAGIDPVSLEAAQTKKHLAREGTVDANLSAELNEAGAAKDGNNSNRRARVPMITPRIEARAKPNVIYRRKKPVEVK